MSIRWRLHRDELHHKRNTCRGILKGPAPLLGRELVTLQTVENLARRIRPGVYLCRRDTWHRLPGKDDDVETFEILYPDEDGDGDPDRDRLLFHWANAVRNRKGRLLIRGCVCSGLKRVEDTWETFYPGKVSALPAVARHLPGVSSSRTAFRKFMDANAGVREFILEVTERADLPWPEA